MNKVFVISLLLLLLVSGVYVLAGEETSPVSCESTLREPYKDNLPSENIFVTKIIEEFCDG